MGWYFLLSVKDRGVVVVKMSDLAVSVREIGVDIRVNGEEEEEER